MTRTQSTARLHRATFLTTVILTSVGLGASTCSAPSADHPAFVVPADSLLLDVPVTVAIEGLPAGGATTVRASVNDQTGAVWSSTAQFTASADGTVSLGDPPTGGSYAGGDPMGLFQNMTPESGAAETAAPDLGASSYDVTLEASVAAEVVASTVVRFALPAAAGVTERDLELATDGVAGRLFLPADTSTPHAAIVMWGGSGGGLYPDVDVDAALLAAHGYPALALAYFGAVGLPEALANIPLEYFRTAVTTLARQPGVNPDKVVVMGASRGSEAALLLGVHYPDVVHAVVAAVPSSLVFGGYPDTNPPAWTFEGQPVPFASLDDFATRTTNPADAPDAIIPVESIPGPILTVCGSLDSVWNSCGYQSAIADRRRGKRVGTSDVVLSYPAAGHFVGAMTCCYSLVEHEGGGLLADNARAREDAHGALLDFLAAQ